MLARSLCRPILALTWGLCAAVGTLPPARAQEVREQAVPFSVWLDFERLADLNAPRTPLPIWLEAVREQRYPAKLGQPEYTTFRLMVRRVGLVTNELQMRLFFDDLPGASPEVITWNEIGTARYRSGALGEGLGLPTSETVIVSLAGVNYLEITVPGTGENMRGVFLSTVEKMETRYALDFGKPSSFAEPFGNVIPSTSPSVDTRLLGRTRATLQEAPFKISYAEPAEWALTLEKQPALALITFDVLHADVDFVPEFMVNGRTLGPAAAQWPDLADPAFTAEVRPREQDARFHYTGWVRCQKVVPGSYLKGGENELRISLRSAASEVAIRNLEIQLKPLPSSVE